MEQKKTIIPALMAAIITAVVIAILFYPISIHPNSYMFNGFGDGLKNYFTPAWYVRYDKGVHFTAMNYPFGEHMTFTDNQPLLSWTLSFLNHIIPIDKHVVSIMNILMLISPCITAFVLSLILSFFNVRGFVNVWLSIALAILAPQLMRVTSHYGLSYSWLFPVYWLLALKYFSESKTRYIIWGTLFLTVIGFLHLYYVFICSAFGLSMAVVNGLYNRNKKSLIQSALWLITGIMPFILHLLFFKLTDNVTDRPQAPWGFLISTATLNTIFLPNENCFLYSYIDALHIISSWHWEGYAYIGAVGTIAAVIVLCRGIYYIVRRRDLGFSMPSALSISMIAAVLVLLLSTGFPFNWPLNDYIDKFKFVRQFRSLGRLAWVFYYVMTVYGAVYFYNLYLTIKKRKAVLAYILIWSIILVWFTDAGVYAYNISRVCKGYENIFWAHPTDGSNINTKDYQAIIALPFFSEGSEKFYGDVDFTVVKEAMMLAYNTHLPMVDGMMSRTSFKQSTELLGLFSNPLMERTLYPALQHKNILLLVNAGDSLPLPEKLLVSNATYISTLYDIFKLYSVSPDMFEKIHNQYLDSARHTIMNYDSICIVHKPFSIWKHIESMLPARHELFDTFLYKGYEKSLVIYNDTLPAVWDGKWCVASWWYRVYLADDGVPVSTVDCIDKSGKNIEHDETSAKISRDYTQGWLRVEYRFKYTAGNTVRLSSAERHIGINSLLIQQEGTHITGRDNAGRYWYDNYPIPGK